MERGWNGNLKIHLPCTRLVTSAAIRGSISIAVTCLAFSRLMLKLEGSVMVRFPVPGPTSSTLGLRGTKVFPGFVYYISIQSKKTNSLPCLRMRKTRGEDIWYGVFDMQTSK